MLSSARNAPQLGCVATVYGIIFQALCLIAVLVMAAAPTPAADTADEHASHHPAEAGGGMPATSQAVAGQAPPNGMSGGTPAGGMMAQMGDMMKGMGTTKKKEIYPSLMDLPELTQEKRLEVSQQATQRMFAGTKLMGQALDALSVGEETGNFAAMHQAMNSLREGTAQLESGIAARRALAEGRVPREVALEWFKREMNLSFVVTSDTDELLTKPGFHYLIIAMLAVFAVAMIAMYYVKMRRAHALLARLTGGDVPADGTTTNEATSSSKDSAPSTTGKESGGGAAQPPVKGEEPVGAKNTSVPASAPQSPDMSPAPAATDASVPVSTGLPSSGWKGILRVNRIFDETPGVKTYRLTAQDGGPIPFTYLPGQYLILSPMLEGKRTPRSYTIASSPTQRHYCELTIKREADGKGVSRYVHDGLQEGELIEATGPIGHFTFTGAEAKHVVLIGGGVGITPLMSYIRFLTDSGWSGDIFFLYTCRHVSDYIFRSELEALSARHPRLHLLVTITRPNDEPWSGLTGRLTKEVIAHAVPDIATRLIYVCGPDAMMRSAQGALLELGVPATQVKTEAFSAPQGAQIGVTLPTDLLSIPLNGNGNDSSAAALPKGETEAPPEREAKPNQPQNPLSAGARPSPKSPDSAAAGVYVTFQKSGKPAPLTAGLSILEAAESVEVPIDFECRVGTCGRCKVKLLSGAVTMEVEDALSSSEKSSGVILACQAKPTGNCTVDA